MGVFNLGAFFIPKKEKKKEKFSANNVQETENKTEKYFWEILVSPGCYRERNQNNENFIFQFDYWRGMLKHEQIV